MTKKEVLLILAATIVLIIFTFQLGRADDISDYLHQGQQQQLPQVIAPYHTHTYKPPTHCSERSDLLGHIYVDCSDGTRATTLITPFGHSYTTVTTPDGQHHESACFITALGIRYCDNDGR